MIQPIQIYIAVVDDDESLCRSLGRLLRASGFQVITYCSAEAFLADEKHPKFDCLIVDIQLGGMSGIQLNLQLLSQNDQTPVIYLTAHDSVETREEAKAADCAAYFCKNDSGAEVIKAIRRVTERNRIVDL